MCGRYLLTAPIESVRQTFGVGAPFDIPARYNIAPTQPVLAVRYPPRSGPGEPLGERELVALEWGLVPEWAKVRPDKPLINARSETASEKPSFRAAVKRQRCLLPFTGWYEWRSENGVRQPYLIRFKDPERVGAFAGIWTTWHGEGGENWLETTAILTAAATAELAYVHKRRPLSVKPGDFERWLQPHDPLPSGFLGGFDWDGEAEFETVKVSTRVNSIRFDDPECLAPPEPPAPPSPPRQGSLF